MQYKIRDIIREYKCMDGKDIFRCIGVRNDQLRIMAYLYPITCKAADDFPFLIDLLSKWRKENPEVSNNSFEVSNERTAKWLNEIVISDEQKIFFLIVDSRGEPVGHIGLCKINEEMRSADIYAVLKGNKNSEKGIMTFCLRRLLEWARAELGINRFYLGTKSDNFRAIRFYERIGFVVTQTVPLERVQLKDEIKWVRTDKNNAEKYDVRMEYKGEIQGDFVK